MKKLLAISTLVFAFLAGEPAHADVLGPLNSVNTITTQPTDFPPGLQLIFLKFDQTLGTLTQMTISLSSSLSTNLTVNATGASCGNVRTYLQVTVVDQNNKLITVTDELITGSMPFSIGDGGGTVHINGVTKSGYSSADSLPAT